MHLVKLVVAVECDVEAPARRAGRGVGQPDDQPEDGTQPQHLGCQLDRLFRVAGHRVRTCVQGGYIGAGRVQSQLVEVVLENTMHQHRVVSLADGLVDKQLRFLWNIQLCGLQRKLCYT